MHTPAVAWLGHYRVMKRMDVWNQSYAERGCTGTILTLGVKERDDRNIYSIVKRWSQ
jgi:hypothetical protein